MIRPSSCPASGQTWGVCAHACCDTQRCLRAREGRDGSEGRAGTKSGPGPYEAACVPGGPAGHPQSLPRTWAPAFLGWRVPAPQAPVLILDPRKTAFLLEAQTCALTQFIKHLPKEGWQGAGGGVGHPRDEWPSESGGRGASSLPGHLGAPAGHLSAKCSG